MRYESFIKSVVNTPWAVRPEHLSILLDLVAMRAAGERLTDEEMQARIGAAPRRRQAVTHGSVAVIPLAGVLMPHAGLMTQVSGATSVEQFGKSVAQATADPSVDAILLNIDSPGGMTDLIPEVAAQIRAGRRVKPIIAVANTDAASAAYWLGSQASQLFVTPSGLVGSIGVFAAHDDMSAAMEQRGIRTTLISAGKHKTETSPFAPLTDEAHAAIQDRVDQFYGMFVDDVAKGRRVSVETVRGGFGEGRIVTAKDAATMGMVDGVATFDEALALAQRAGAATAGDAESSSTASAAGPIPVKETPVIDEPWDGPAAVAAAPQDRDVLRWMHAWVDDAADPDTKGAYKFPHHAPEPPSSPANINGVRAAMGRLMQARIPEGDRAGVRLHLQRHMDDWARSQSRAEVMRESARVEARRLTAQRKDR